MRFPVRLAPVLGAIMISGLAFTLVVVIIAQSPYTHGNLRPEGYNRTDIIYVGDDLPYRGFSLANPELARTGDPVRDGLAIFVAGCASCHGLDGQGGAVGPALDLDELSVADLRKDVRKGPKGMPAFLEQVHQIVEAQMHDSHFSVERLADEVNMSPRQLRRRLRALTKLSPSGYIRTMRLQRAAQLLEQQAGRISEVAYAVGFHNAEHFSRLFQQVFGVAPSQYKADQN